VKGGRCEACSGDGVIAIEMHFLPDVYVTCEVCGGRRYDRETLEVKWKGLSIADVLDLTVAEALEMQGNIPALRSPPAVLGASGRGTSRRCAAGSTSCARSGSTTSGSGSRRRRCRGARRSG